MDIKPMNDSIIGQVIKHEESELLNELSTLTAGISGGRGYEFDAARRQLEASLSPKKQPYQVTVVATGPDVTELEVGDIAFLPEGGGTMITVHDEEDGTFQHLFVISEKAVLARFPAGE